MAHTPAPDPTLSPARLARSLDKMRGDLQKAADDRVNANGLTDYVKKLEAVRKSNAEIRALIAVAHGQLGISKVELADRLGMTRQALHNIENHKARAGAPA